MQNMAKDLNVSPVLQCGYYMHIKDGSGIKYISAVVQCKTAAKIPIHGTRRLLEIKGISLHRKLHRKLELNIA